MASNRDESGYKPYTPDEFDDPPEGPVGVHRGPRSLALRAVPYIVIILLAALCGVGTWMVFSGSKLPWQHTQTTNSQVQQQVTRQPSSNQSTTHSPQTSSPPQSTATPSTQQPAPAPSPEPSADKAAAIKIINGTGISGHAASKREALVAAGYTNVTAANPSGQLPTASVVWYHSEADKATAADVAKTLGISQVEQSAGAASAVVVVLLN